MITQILNLNPFVSNNSENEITPPLNPSSYYFKINELFVGKNNAIPDSSRIVNLYSKTGSKTLLIVFGESWTYGDSLHPYVNCVRELDNIPYRISTVFAGKLANWLNSDLLLCAEPGNSNMGYWSQLENLLNEYKNIKDEYDEVYLVIQMTSPGRDYSKHFTHDKLKHLFSVTDNNYPKLEWKDWLIEYDRLYLNWLSELTNKYNFNGVVVWKNFNEFHIRDFDKYNFGVVDIPFHRYAPEMSGHRFEVADILEMTFFEDIHRLKNLIYDDKTIELQLKKIEDGWFALGNSMLNNFHPNDIGHWVLATRIRDVLEKL
jgi:hypothetical protein